MREEKLEKATFGAGCFWHVEDTFMKTKGVKETASGFMGGTAENPSYSLVCGGKTGHAEVVQIEFDSKEVSYEKLLEVFWESHDPTQSNKQGLYFGNQYRSIIFYHTPEQKKAAEKSKKELEESKKYNNPIATLIAPASDFYKAEEYHQEYYEKNKGRLFGLF